VTGTSVLGLTFSGGVLIASDTLGTAVSVGANSQRALTAFEVG
jgi:20S proteasome alpha/beta subunit